MLLLVSLAGLLAQVASPKTAPPPLLEFDVASVKPSSPNLLASSVAFLPGGGLRIDNEPLVTLIAFAYGVYPFQVVGGPAWMSSERFDMEAKAAEPIGSSTNSDLARRQRLRSLLSDRFRLVVREEKREMPVYAVTIAKSGSKLKRAREMTTGEGFSTGMPGKLNGTNSTVGALAESLSSSVGRPVLDESGLVGRFDWNLTWVAESVRPTLSSVGGEKPGPAAPSDVSGPSLFTAIQQKLGLRLESKKGLAPAVIVERVERPSAN